VVDDELYADVGWQKWDAITTFAMGNTAEVHRTKRLLSQQLPLNQDQRRSILISVSEALANVRRHAYAGRDGPACVSWRDEGSRVRVEVADQGRGLPPFVEHGGFAVMRGQSDTVDVRRAFPSGTIVSLSKAKTGDEDEQPR
jgi:anti-sigma regulatory factor (Ser/Thr protein kinase)